MNVEVVMFYFMFEFDFAFCRNYVCCVKVRSKLEKKMVVLAFCSLVVL